MSHRVRMERYARSLTSWIGRYDVCQWHCFEPNFLPALAFFPPDAKIVLTVWGSDLLRTSGADSYQIQLQACERATRIVVHCVEMREIFLAKFGRRFADKMRLATAGCDFFEVMDQLRATETTVALPFELPAGKVVVCVGNNGSVINRHLEILASISALDARIREGLVILLPMTYGGDPTYVAEVEAAAAKAGVDYRMLTKRVSAEQIAEIRCRTDVMVHMPVSDAFSAAVAEAVYGGAVLIVGAWLPYGFLRRRGIKFHEVEEYASLGSRLEAVVTNLAEEKEIAAPGAGVMKELKAWPNVIHGWAELYAELV
jgi:hypothetical protein